MDTTKQGIPETLLHSLWEHSNDVWVFYDGPLMGTVEYKGVRYFYNATWEDNEEGGVGGPLFLWIIPNRELLQKVADGQEPVTALYENDESLLFREHLDADGDVFTLPISYNDLTPDELPRIRYIKEKTNE
jgi:hypothetical protein